MRSKVSVGEYLAFLSTKFELDPDSFFQALITADKDKKSKCGDLSITCRSRTTERAIMLISKGQKVVAQFPVPRWFLTEQRNPIKPYGRFSLTGKTPARKPENMSGLRIKDLRTGMKQINLKARIVEIPEPKMVFTRFGNYASVINATIADETGQVKLCLWNEQAESLNIGDTVQIENAHLSTYRGEKQLRIGKKGTLNSIEDLNGS